MIRMKTRPCNDRHVLNPCTLKDLNHQVDPYVGCEHHCYYCYVLEQAETDWREEILVHEDLTNRLKRELSAIAPQAIYMGWQTDPYQPCEREHRQTRQVLEVLLEKGFSARILTKSDLVLRDMDILQKMKEPRVSVSVAFNDNEIRQLFEANTLDTEARISALEKLKKAGIGTSALICPVIPHITTVIPLIEMLEPHADRIWIYGLSIANRSDRSWQNVQGIVEKHFPAVKQEVETIVFSRDHSYWANLRQELKGIQKNRRLNLSIHL